ncbi:MAG: hypothetical protein RI963_1574 [Planctomycetota bacterium]|jgi:hypothetical protein
MGPLNICTLMKEKRLTRTRSTTKILNVSVLGLAPCNFCMIHSVARVAANIVILSEVVKRRDDAHLMASPRPQTPQAGRPCQPRPHSRPDGFATATRREAPRREAD